MVNFLIENEDASADSGPIAEVLDRITEYASCHFQTEELVNLTYTSDWRDHTDFKANAIRNSGASASSKLEVLRT